MSGLMDFEWDPSSSWFKRVDNLAKARLAQENTQFAAQEYLCRKAISDPNIGVAAAQIKLEQIYNRFIPDGPDQINIDSSTRKKLDGDMAELKNDKTDPQRKTELITSMSSTLQEAATQIKRLVINNVLGEQKTQIEDRAKLEDIKATLIKNARENPANGFFAVTIKISDDEKIKVSRKTAAIYNDIVKNGEKDPSSTLKKVEAQLAGRDLFKESKAELQKIKGADEKTPPSNDVAPTRPYR